MLSQKEIKKYRDIVLKEIPDFKVGLPLGHPNSIEFFRGGYFDIQTGKAGAYGSKISLYLPSSMRICSCCGFLGLRSVNMKNQQLPVDVGPAEMSGVGSLGSFTLFQEALFALWLNDNPLVYHSALTIATASYANSYSEGERMIQRVGFQAVCRSMNPNHGPERTNNAYVTLWVFKCLPDVPVDKDQKFVEEVGNAV
jgi:hypothetical protein